MIMKTQQWQLKYIKWFSAEDMHEATIHWLSELNFIKDEHLFFEHLLEPYINLSKKYSPVQNLLEEISILKEECKCLTSVVLSHQNKLDVLVDGINQIKEEELYKETHHELVDTMNQFLLMHQQLKKDLFKTVKAVMKDQKTISI